MANTNYNYKGQLLQTSGSDKRGWICFINGEDLLFAISDTEIEALKKAKNHIDSIESESK